MVSHKKENRLLSYDVDCLVLKQIETGGIKPLFKRTCKWTSFILCVPHSIGES